MRKRMTRQQIKEGLEQVPIEQVLLGHNRAAHKVALTAKQLKFADALARGDSKAGAYRKAYNTKTNPTAQSVEGCRLSKNPKVALQIEAIKLALEAEKYATPLHLRALIIQKLTEKALDPDVNHAQQLRALELLGKVTEIAAFTERRETVHIHDAQAIRDKLMHSLKLAINADAQTLEYSDADDLLAELTPTTGDFLPGETPPAPHPQDPEHTGGNTTYSIPHPRSDDCNNVTITDCNNVTEECNNVTDEADCNNVTNDCNSVTDCNDVTGETVTRVTVVAKIQHSDEGGGGSKLLEAKDG